MAFPFPLGPFSTRLNFSSALIPLSESLLPALPFPKMFHLPVPFQLPVPKTPPLKLLLDRPVFRSELFPSLNSEGGCVVYLLSPESRGSNRVLVDRRRVAILEGFGVSPGVEPRREPLLVGWGGDCPYEGVGRIVFS